MPYAVEIVAAGNLGGPCTAKVYKEDRVRPLAIGNTQV